MKDVVVNLQILTHEIKYYNNFFPIKLKYLEKHFSYFNDFSSKPICFRNIKIFKLNTLKNIPLIDGQSVLSSPKNLIW